MNAGAIICVDWHSSIERALAVLAERVQGLDVKDRTDLVAMAKIFFGDADLEEREAAERAIAEILEPPTGRVLSAEEWSSAAPPVERSV